MVKKKPTLIEQFHLDGKKPKSLKETLQKVLEILQDPDHWVKNKMFARSDKRKTEKVQAQRVCIVGALTLVDGRYENKAYNTILATIREMDEEGLSYAIEDFNDRRSTTHGDIIRILDKVIEQLG